MENIPFELEPVKFLIKQSYNDYNYYLNILKDSEEVIHYYITAPHMKNLVFVINIGFDKSSTNSHICKVPKTEEDMKWRFTSTDWVETWGGYYQNKAHLLIEFNKYLEISNKPKPEPLSSLEEIEYVKKLILTAKDLEATLNQLYKKVEIKINESN